MSHTQTFNRDPGLQAAIKEAKALRGQGKYIEAAQTLANHYEAGKNDPLYLRGYAKSLHEAGSLDEAIEITKMLSKVETDPIKREAAEALVEQLQPEKSASAPKGPLSLGNNQGPAAAPAA